jgi:1-acyl-sn-glycerol-3-phosphate acyltransferase
MNESVSTSTQNPWYNDLSIEARDNMGIIHEYFDLEFTKGIIKKVINHLSEYYFRPRFIGFENMPSRNNPDVPLIFASNHSGMAFPWDGIILAAGVYEMFNYGPDSFRPLASPMLSESILMNPYLHENLWKIVGSVDASFLNFETMMLQNEHNLLIYPEGVPGIGKGFNKRYQFQRFSSSFITMSIKYKTDIVPVLTINGEYINPFAYRSGWANRIVNKIGVPFFPVGFVSLFLPLQPWIFYMGFPAKLTYVLGKAIKPYEMTDKSLNELSYEELVSIKEAVRADMQAQLSDAVKKYGKNPYHIREFVGKTVRNIGRFPYTMPIGWPLLFAYFNILWKKNKIDEKPLKLGFLSTLKIIFLSPKQLLFYLPVIGWIPLLIRGIRKRPKHQPSQKGR